MYMYIHTHIHIYIYIYIYTRTYTHMYIHTDACVHLQRCRSVRIRGLIIKPPARARKRAVTGATAMGSPAPRVVTRPTCVEFRNL